MIFRWRSEGVKFADIAEVIADVFETANTRHELATADRRIGDRAVIFLNQANPVAFFIFEFKPL
ncbi:hypothetical protein D3C80_1816080 [compost metagenome]